MYVGLMFAKEWLRFRSIAITPTVTANTLVAMQMLLNAHSCWALSLAM